MMSSPAPLEVLILVRPRLFASVLGRLLDSAAHHVTVVDPDDGSMPESEYDVAVISDGVAAKTPGAAVIRLPEPEGDRSAGTIRIGSQHEIVRFTSPTELVALIDRAGMASRRRGRS
jgi:hypothetical protein